jgi:AcrR family transcriptional regulator
MMTPSLELLGRVTKAFMDRGYQHMTMVALSESCGFTRRSIYNYFANKDEAFRAMFRQYNLDSIDRAWTHVFELRKSDASVLDIVTGLIDVRYGDTWRLLATSPHGAEIKGTAFAICIDIMIELAVDFQRDVEHLIDELAAEGRLSMKPAFTAAQLSQMLTDAARGVNQVYPTADVSDLKAQYRRTCEAILYGYAT